MRTPADRGEFFLAAARPDGSGAGDLSVDDGSVVDALQCSGGARALTGWARGAGASDRGLTARWTPPADGGLATLVLAGGSPDGYYIVTRAIQVGVARMAAAAAPSGDLELCGLARAPAAAPAGTAAGAAGALSVALTRDPGGGAVKFYEENEEYLGTRAAPRVVRGCVLVMTNGGGSQLLSHLLMGSPWLGVILRPAMTGAARWARFLISRRPVPSSRSAARGRGRASRAPTTADRWGVCPCGGVRRHRRRAAFTLLRLA